MPDMDGVEFLRQLSERLYDGTLILVSGAEERFCNRSRNWSIQPATLSALSGDGVLQSGWIGRGWQGPRAAPRNCAALSTMAN
jgi:hypothetical protein